MLTCVVLKLEFVQLRNLSSVMVRESFFRWTRQYFINFLRPRSLPTDKVWQTIEFSTGAILCEDRWHIQPLLLWQQALPVPISCYHSNWTCRDQCWTGACSVFRFDSQASTGFENGTDFCSEKHSFHIFWDTDSRNHFENVYSPFKDIFHADFVC